MSIKFCTFSHIFYFDKVFKIFYFGFMIKNNIEILERLKNQIDDHPMAANVLIDERRIRVLFPEGTDGLFDGVQCDFRDGKIKAFEKVLNRLEEFWKQTNDWWLS